MKTTSKKLYLIIVIGILSVVCISCNKNPEFPQGDYLYEYNDLTPGNRIGDLFIVWPEDEEISEERKAVIQNLVSNMVRVEGGTFMMGAQNSNPTGQQYDADAQADESPVHQVTLSEFYIGKYEITQQEWLAVMGYEKDWPSNYGHGEKIPAYNISKSDAEQFVKRLSELTRLPFMLPTEAQWEFAARGGNKSQHYRYSGGNNVDEVAWHNNNTGNVLHNVGEKKANELGLYDMSGSLWEWCLDTYYPYPTESHTDPCHQWGAPFVLRGGSWTYFPVFCRATCRDSYSDNRSISNGFRVVLKNK